MTYPVCMGKRNKRVEGFRWATRKKKQPYLSAPVRGPAQAAGKQPGNATGAVSPGNAPRGQDAAAQAAAAERLLRSGCNRVRLMMAERRWGFPTTTFGKKRRPCC